MEHTISYIAIESPRERERQADRHSQENNEKIYIVMVEMELRNSTYFRKHRW